MVFAKGYKVKSLVLKLIGIFFLALLPNVALFSQVRLGEEGEVVSLNYLNPAEYEVGGITFSGASCDVRNLAFAVGDII